MKKLTYLLFILPIAVLYDAQAVTLFSSLGGIDPVTPSGISSQNFVDAGVRTQGADDFTVPGGNSWLIESIEVNGEYAEFTAGGPASGPATSVNVYILGNSGTLPDTTNLSAGAIYAAENISYTDSDSGDFIIPLPGGGVTLLAGTYWLVVQANMTESAGGQWLWTESASAGFASAWFQNSPGLIPPASGGAFTCVDAWGARIATCDITVSPDPNPPAEPDLAFALEGVVLTAGVTVNPAAFTTTENGSNATFDVVLTAPPAGGNTVTINVSSSDVTEGTVAPGSLDFTAANWDVPQTVTITPGASGDGNDGDVMYAVMFSVSSGDGAYNGLAVPDANGNNINIDGVATITVDPISGLQVSEDGVLTATVTISAGPDVTPNSDVTIGLTNNSPALVSLSAASVVLTIGNGYSVLVPITGVDDNIVNGSRPFSITTAVSVSTDPAFNGIDPPDISGTLLDDDFAGISVTAAGGEPINTDEAGTLSGTIDVVLRSEPAADVTVNFFSSDPGEGTVSPASLTFTAANWDTPQSVTVAGVDDAEDDGDVSYTLVTQPLVSADPEYSNLDPADVTAINIDDDDTVLPPTPVPSLSALGVMLLSLLLLIPLMRQRYKA